MKLSNTVPGFQAEIKKLNQELKVKCSEWENALPLILTLTLTP